MGNKKSKQHPYLMRTEYIEVARFVKNPFDIEPVGPVGCRQENSRREHP